MTIAQISEWSGLSKDTLRYYEKVGLLEDIKRDENGYREYDENDQKQVEFIKCMRKTDISLKGLIDFRELIRAGDDTIQDRLDILEEQKSKIEKEMKELEETIDYLNYKTSLYYDLLKEKK